MKIKVSFNLSRAWEHFTNKQFAVISAWRKEFTIEKNEERGEELKDLVRSKGLGYKEVKGVWHNAAGEVENEYPLFIPLMSYNDALELGAEFNQDTIICGDGEKIIIVDPKSNKLLEEFTNMETAFQQAWTDYSQLKARINPEKAKQRGQELRRFRFTSVDWTFINPPELNSYMNAVGIRAWSGAKATSYFDHSRESRTKKSCVNCGKKL